MKENDKRQVVASTTVLATARAAGRSNLVEHKERYMVSMVEGTCADVEDAEDMEDWMVLTDDDDAGVVEENFGNLYYFCSL
jgi:hypothetical protein